MLPALDMTFITKNVQSAVEGVADIEYLRGCLGVPETKRQEIHGQFSSVSQQVKAYINYFMDHNPVASWRAVIIALDGMGEMEAAENIRHLAEPVVGRAGIIIAIIL